MTWTKPDKRGSEITSYKIYLQQQDSNWHQDTANCDGSISAIVSGLTCTIPITVLEAAPFSLPGQAVVFAKITATNGIGESAESPASPSTGNPGFIAEVPTAPTSLEFTTKPVQLLK